MRNVFPGRSGSPDQLTLCKVARNARKSAPRAVLSSVGSEPAESYPGPETTLIPDGCPWTQRADGSSNDFAGPRRISSRIGSGKFPLHPANPDSWKKICIANAYVSGASLTYRIWTLVPGWPFRASRNSGPKERGATSFRNCSSFSSASLARASILRFVHWLWQSQPAQRQARRLLCPTRLQRVWFQPHSRKSARQKIFL
jgi:hypothetical protein